MMVFHEVIRFFFSTLENISIVVLSLALFRIPFKYSASKVLIISFVLSIVSLFQRDYLHLDEFVTVSLMIAYVILFRFIFNFPIFYALLVSITGYLIYGAIQTLMVVAGTSMGLTTPHDITYSLVDGSVLQFVSTSATLLLTLWMQRKKIGFMFVIKRLTIKHIFNSFNLILSFIILLAITTAQLVIISFIDNFSMIFALVALMLVLFIGLAITYRKNKNDIKEKYERLKK